LVIKGREVAKRNVKQLQRRATKRTVREYARPGLRKVPRQYLRVAHMVVIKFVPL